MFGVKSQIDDRMKRVETAEKIASRENLFHAAAIVRKSIIENIEIDKTVIGFIRRKTKTGRTRLVKVYKPSQPGQPVIGHRSRGFWRAGTRFHVDRNRGEAIIGPTASKMGDAISTHEFGKHRFGIKYPKRPTIGPSLEREQDRIPKQWAGTIGD